MDDDEKTSTLPFNCCNGAEVETSMMLARSVNFSEKKLRPLDLSEAQHSTA